MKAIIYNGKSDRFCQWLNSYLSFRNRIKHTKILYTSNHRPTILSPITSYFYLSNNEINNIQYMKKYRQLINVTKMHLWMFLLVKYNGNHTDKENIIFRTFCNETSYKNSERLHKIFTPTEMLWKLS